MSFATVAQKAADPAFKARLEVAVTEFCRYTLGRPRGDGESEERYAWTQSMARQVLQDICNDRDARRIARLVLLPVDWTGFDPDQDTPIQSRVEERFHLFVSSPRPE